MQVVLVVVQEPGERKTSFVEGGILPVQTNKLTDAFMICAEVPDGREVQFKEHLDAFLVAEQPRCRREYNVIFTKDRTSWDPVLRINEWARNWPSMVKLTVKAL